MFRVESDPVSGGIVVCDGVGSFADSGEVAERVLDIALHHLEGNEVQDGMASCAQCVAEALRHAPDESLGRTTMIAGGADEAGRVAFCYVGNGAFLELQGTPLGDGRTRLSWANHTLPHISYDRGREALSSYLPGAGDRDPAVSTGTLGPGGHITRLFLACTDGIFSAEEARTGKMPDDSVWTEVPETIARVLQDLEALWNKLEVSDAPETELTACLSSTLDALREEGVLEDDATVGAILVRPFRKREPVAEVGA